jgi:hypothetical protein
MKRIFADDQTQGDEDLNRAILVVSVVALLPGICLARRASVTRHAGPGCCSRCSSIIVM